jgi:hypothetical protein
MTCSTGKTLREIHYEKVKDYKESYKFFFHLKFQNNKKTYFSSTLSSYWSFENGSANNKPYLKIW